MVVVQRHGTPKLVLRLADVEGVLVGVFRGGRVDAVQPGPAPPRRGTGVVFVHVDVPTNGAMRRAHGRKPARRRHRDAFAKFSVVVRLVQFVLRGRAVRRHRDHHRRRCIAVVGVGDV